MHRLNPIQLTLHLGGALVIIGLTVFIVYILHKAFQQQRQPESLGPMPPRAQDATGFALASLQGVITRMKAREREMEALLREAEQRADSSTRRLEAVVRELAVGLFVVSREGFVTLANPTARELLAIDTWSRRRYPEILGTEAALTHHLKASLESGASLHAENVEYRLPNGEVVLLEVSLSPYHGRSGQIEGAVCFLRKK
ncbi:MAG: PAS domain-containing protein [Acidobacteriia bacterium]|nr:PAS domain-containing protein [Terriglobia bacterium]